MKTSKRIKIDYQRNVMNEMSEKILDDQKVGELIREGFQNSVYRRPDQCRQI